MNNSKIIYIEHAQARITELESIIDETLDILSEIEFCCGYNDQVELIKEKLKNSLNKE